jgi:hypothetical protein
MRYSLAFFVPLMYFNKVPETRGAKMITRIISEGFDMAESFMLVDEFDDQMIVRPSIEDQAEAELAMSMYENGLEYA